MSISLQFDITGYQEIVNRLGNAGPKIEAWARDVVDEGAGIFLKEVIAQAPLGATGLTKRGMIKEVTGAGVQITGRVYNVIGESNPVRIAAVETGRRPGRMPPWGPGSDLHRWVAHFIGGDTDAVSFLVARKIGERGTQGHFMFRKAYSAKAGQVRALIQARQAELARRIIAG